MKRLIAALWVVLLLGGNGCVAGAGYLSGYRTGYYFAPVVVAQPIMARNARTLTPVPMGRDDVASHLTAIQRGWCHEVASERTN